MEKAAKRNSFETRIHEIDLLRGILMTLVILDHFLNILASYNLGWAGGKVAIELGTALEPYVTIYRLASLYWILYLDKYSVILLWVLLFCQRHFMCFFS